MFSNEATVGLVLAFALVVMILLLAGCGATQTVTEYVDRPVEVKVPVAVPCVTETPKRPEYETQTLEADDPIGVVARAYRIERQQREAFESALLAELEGCQ